MQTPKLQSFVKDLKWINLAFTMLSQFRPQQLLRPLLHMKQVRVETMVVSMLTVVEFYSEADEFQ